MRVPGGGRTAFALALLAAVLLAVPFFVGNYVLSVLVVFLFAAYLGQCWNIMMGFAGLLSLGHALYAGLGAYVSAALYVRFGVTGVYFALLTIAFDEFTRILFDHFDWVGGSAGLFLPVKTLTHSDVLQLRGSPAMFYYLLLALSAAVLVLSRTLLDRRIGYYWLAIREDQEAAQSLGIDVFRYKMAAVMLSAALTAVAGALQAFYDNNLYPDTIFTTARSVEIITGPVIGGVGTLFGPIVGAFVLTTLGEAMTVAGSYFGIPGLKQWFYGAALVIIVLLQPSGLWPWIRRSLRLGEDAR